MFAFPNKTGIKADPAVYLTLARNAAEFGHWWPLHHSPYMFPEFYEHPPFLLWAMAGVFKIFGVSEWSGALLSRLLTLASLVILGWIFYSEKSKIFSRSALVGAVWLGGLFSLTWVPWVKYVGAAQYEGPLSFVILLSFASILIWFSPGSFSVTRIMLLFSVGLLGFLVKGIIFFPILFSPLIFSIFQRPLSTHLKKGLLATGLLSTAWFFGALLMWELDRRSQTSWSQAYWQRILGWGFQNSNTFDVDKGFSSLKIFELSLQMLKMELRMSPIWTPMLWVSMAWLLIKKRNLLFQNRILLLSLIFYWAFIAPFMIATIKMPHWPVPIYPIGALFLVSLFSPDSLQKIGSFFEKSQIPTAFVFFIAIFLALAPGIPRTRLDRGDQWRFHKETLQKVKNDPRPLTVVTDEEPMYMVNAYSAWHLGSDYPIRFLQLTDVLKAPCDSRFLWLGSARTIENQAKLELLGWRPATHQAPAVMLFECAAKVQ